MTQRLRIVPITTDVVYTTRKVELSCASSFLRRGGQQRRDPARHRHNPAPDEEPPHPPPPNSPDVAKGHDEIACETRGAPGEGGGRGRRQEGHARKPESVTSRDKTHTRAESGQVFGIGINPHFQCRAARWRASGRSRTPRSAATLPEQSERGSQRSFCEISPHTQHLSPEPNTHQLLVARRCLGPRHKGMNDRQ